MGARGDKVEVTRELVETEGGCGRGVAQSRVGAVRGRIAGGCLDCASQFSGRPPRQAGLRREDAAPEMERDKEKRVPAVVPAYMSGCGAGALLLVVAVATASGTAGGLGLPSSLLAPEQIQQLNETIHWATDRLDALYRYKIVVVSNQSDG